jgi:hypothetical protein
MQGGAVMDNENNKKDEAKTPKQADILIKIAEKAELFHSPDSTCFADMLVGEHRETWPVKSKGFRRWLAHHFYDQTNGAPNSEAMASAINVIEAKAHFDSPQRIVHVRVGGVGDTFYVDLGGSNWRAISISSKRGWEEIERPPVRFRRSAGMLALPAPVRVTNVVEVLKEFRKLINVKSNEDFDLIIAWLIATLRHYGPYPVLVLFGEQGAAKSTLAKILRWLIDPNSAPLRALPREDRDLFIAANNGYVLTFDNVSGLPTWISDTLCRLATGGGFACRSLYTDQDEVLFDAQRPIILNGIEDIVSRPDLADRSMFIGLDPIPENKRKTEIDVMTAVEAIRPQVLGALLNSVVHGLKRVDSFSLDRLPRMADFAKWAAACETAHSSAGAFMKAYDQNMADAVSTVIEADLVATAVIEFMTKRAHWEGTAKDLLGALAPIVGETIAKQKDWPKTPRAIAGRLARAAATLRKIGISVNRGDKHSRERHRFVLENRGKQCARSAQCAPDTDFCEKSVHVGAHCPDDGAHWEEPMCTDKPLKSNGGAHGAHGARYSTPFSGATPCPACDGAGCPTCQPRRFGIGADPFESIRDPSLSLRGDPA